MQQFFKSIFQCNKYKFTVINDRMLSNDWTWRFNLFEIQNHCQNHSFSYGSKMAVCIDLCAWFGVTGGFSSPLTVRLSCSGNSPLRGTVITHPHPAKAGLSAPRQDHVNLLLYFQEFSNRNPSLTLWVLHLRAPLNILWFRVSQTEHSWFLQRVGV